MAHLILHIGHPKTGTTALQFALGGNGAVLRDRGILYPDSGVDHKHASIAPHLLDLENASLRRRLRATGDKLRRRSGKVWQRICRQCEASDANRIILSGEAFWGAPGQPKVKAMRAELATICETAEVVAYLRSPAPLFMSRLNQRMWVSQTLPVLKQTYFQNYFKRPVTAYSGAGFSRVSLRLFDRGSLLNGDIVDDFCANFLPDLPTTLDKSVIRRSNDSLSAEALAAIQSHAQSNQSRFAFRRRIQKSRLLRAVTEADKSVAGFTRPSLHPEVADAVVAASSDLIWLRDMQGIEFADVDYARVDAKDAIKLDTLAKISDFCPLDEDRFAALKAEVGRLLA